MKTTASNYLVKDMPRGILFGEAQEIEEWCHANDKAIPTLLDLGLARAQIRRNRKSKRGGKR